jgi:ATP-dependent Clp protease protease subunit
LSKKKEKTTETVAKVQPIPTQAVTAAMPNDNDAKPYRKIPDQIIGSFDDNNVILFDEGFSNASVRPVIEFIMRKNFLPAHLRPEYITLIINSPGGNVNSAMALIDIMKGSAIPVRTVGLGLIASCGLLTFMSGEKGTRTLTPNTSILSHQYSWGTGREKEHELFATVKEFDLTSKRIMHLYKHCTGLSESKIREVLLPPQDVWLSAEEAVHHGVADIIKSMY